MYVTETLKMWLQCTKNLASVWTYMREALFEYKHILLSICKWMYVENQHLVDDTISNIGALVCFVRLQILSFYMWLNCCTPLRITLWTRLNTRRRLSWKKGGHMPLPTSTTTTTAALFYSNCTEKKECLNDFSSSSPRTYISHSSVFQRSTGCWPAVSL